MPDVLESEAAREPAVHSGQGVKIVRSCTVNQPAEALFRFWRQFSNLPQFMPNLVSVTEKSATESHWVARRSRQKNIEWDAVIINERPNELIAWQTVAGSDIAHAGSMRLERAPGNQGTELTVTLEYSPLSSELAKLLPRIFGKKPAMQVEADLLRFKALLETGEIPTTHGQSRGSNQEEEEE